MYSPQSPPSTTLIDRVRYWRQTRPEDTAFVFTGNADQDVLRTYRQLDQRARSIAVRLTQLGATGKHVLLLYPSGLDFIEGFLGCLYAGAVAVPLYPPRRNRKMDRIEAICADAEPAVVLTVRDVLDRARNMIDDVEALRDIPCLATDEIADQPEDYLPADVGSETVAVLQYTSGSTGQPKGVVLTHANLVHNCELVSQGFELNPACVGLSWLPTFHDMGLVGGVLVPLFYGLTNVMMSPMAFLQKPVRWLRAITEYGVAVSGAPNFAYQLCVDKISDEECRELDLSTWDVAFNGAEPVRAETLRRFCEKFAPYGFRAEAAYPCFGMAETTLIVTGGTKSDAPVVRAFAGEALERHEVVVAEPRQPDARELVGCGRPLPGVVVRIVDPETGQEVPPRRVGEVFVAGGSVGRGYWNRPEETQRTFRAELAGDPDHRFLRTGDLGFLEDGELFITGRCRDMIIIRGRNLYPQDIECVVEASHPALRAGGSAAFSVRYDDTEQLVLAQEIERGYQPSELDDVIVAIRQAVVEALGVGPHTVVLLNTGKLPVTSSGKVQRSICRDELCRGELAVLKRWSQDQRKTPSGNGRVRLAGNQGPVSSSRDSFGRHDNAAIRHWLQDRIAQRLGVKSDDVDVQAPFTTLEIDSVELVSMSGDLEEWLGRSVSPTLLYSYPTINALADHLASANDPIDAPLDTPTVTKVDHPVTSEPIAVIGVGCRFPGASGPQEFWKLLRDGVDAVDAIPADRWDIEALYNANPEAPGKMITRCGGFVQDVDQFDADFFGIAPREAVGIDPQQRLLLEVAWESLEHAGLAADALSQTATGVFVGICNSDYAALQRRSADLGRIDIHTGTGSINSIAAGRLAYVLGLHGPAMAVDTACSSSLVAVHLAVQSLRRGECRTALAGGVNLILDPSSMVALSKLRALSPDGRCKTFDESADGYGRGEGCGVVVLKRLADAEADGDRVMAVIRGTAVNHDGRSNGLTAPHGPSQSSLIRSAVAEAGIHPSDVGYLEAHGTGTELGDPIEISAAAEVYGQGRSGTHPLILGAVKTNIGHLEAAAGAASLIKVVLSMVHGEIPPHLHLKNPNPLTDWSELPIEVAQRRIPWPPQQGRRLAGVSSFGFSGTNAHLIVEAAPQGRTIESSNELGQELRKERGRHVLALSARNDVALAALADRFAEHLSETDQDWTDICYTAATGRNHFTNRLAIVASDPDEAVEQLRAVAPGTSAPGLHRGVAGEQSSPKIAFLFSGQGAGFAGAGRSLAAEQPTFRRALEDCDAILAEMRLGDELPRSITSVLAGEVDSSGLSGRPLESQLSLFCLQYALTELWRSWGVQPTMVLGHSLGEFAAAVTAGVFSLEAGLKLVATRARLMQGLANPGSMVAVMADRETVDQAIAGIDVSMAAFNGPQQTVIAGDQVQLDEASRRLERCGIACRPINVSHAFHSALMDPILDDFAAACRGISFAAPTCAFVSSVLGRADSEQVATAEYWRDQIRKPVRFLDSIRAAADLDADVYLEIGPAPTLLALGRGSLTGSRASWLPSLREGRDDWSVLLGTLAELYVSGTTPDWHAFDQDYQRRKVPLPTYAFQRRPYWIETSEHASAIAEEVPARSSKAGPTPEWYYEVSWQPRSRLDQQLVRRRADHFPAPTELQSAAGGAVERLVDQLNLPRYLELEASLERLAGGYAWRALNEVGLPSNSGAVVPRESVAEHLGVVEAQRSLLARLLEMLVEDGRLAESEAGWTVGDSTGEDDIDQLAESLSATYPECRAELELLNQCARPLASVLRGDVDPLQILFPGGSPHLVEQLYRDSPFARTLNTVVESSVAAAVSQLPAGRTLKILEIGAGTGGTTAQILPRLPADRCEYVFTDVSELFTRSAQERLGEYSFVRFGALDIEADPAEQGFASGQFDMIIAANVLHATADLTQTLEHTRRLLAPGGLLVLLEGTRPQRWLDLIFGLTDGWWRFQDRQRRPSHPLLSADGWVGLLEQQGFASAKSLPDAATRIASDSTPPQAVVIAQADEQQFDDDQAARVHQPASRDGTCIVLADQQGVGDAVAEHLRAAGRTCLVALAGERYETLADDRYLIDPVSREHVARLLAAAAESGLPPCRDVVHLLGIDVPSTDRLNAQLIESAQQRECASPLVLLRELVHSDWSHQTKLWIATRGTQPVNGTSDMPGLAQTPLWGLGRVLAEELPDHWGGLIDLDPEASVAEAASVLATEITQGDGEDQIAYRRDHRYVARLQPRSRYGVASQPIRWRADASYLVSGGLGDLGLVVARWLAEQGAKHLVLFGRSEFPARTAWDAAAASDPRLAAKIQILREIEERGTSVHIAALDVADESALTRLMDDLRSTGWPPVRGVVHCAGVASACPLLELTVDEFAKVTSPKVTGAWLLEKVLADADLDFFVMFSSGATLLGSPLLASYASANAFLDGLAHHRRESGRHALSVNWGFWDDVGMVARTQREIGRGFAPQGMQSFSPEQGLAALVELLEAQAVQTAVMPVDWNQWAEYHPRASRSPLLSGVLGGRPRGPSSEAPEDPTDRISRATLLAAPVDVRAAMLRELLIEKLAAVLRIAADELDIDQPLNNLGIDSLMAVELRNHLQAQVGLTLPIAQLLQHPTTRQLADRLLEQLADGEDSAPQLVAASDQEAPNGGSESDDSGNDETAAATLARLNELTEAEMDAMLARLQQDTGNDE